MCTKEKTSRKQKGKGFGLLYESDSDSDTNYVEKSYDTHKGVEEEKHNETLTQMDKRRVEETKQKYGELINVDLGKSQHVKELSNKAKQLLESTHIETDKTYRELASKIKRIMYVKKDEDLFRELTNAISVVKRK